MSFSLLLRETAAHVLHTLGEKNLTLTTAESCTGGLISALLTDIPGSSSVFDRGFITYSNASKTAMLGVDASVIAQHGAVSEPVARAMALGAKAKASTDMAVAVTGIAGPGGGSAEKPVGLVFIAVAHAGGSTASRFVFSGEREAVRLQAVDAALRMIAQHAK
jgi:nicotinamide-nucleotide amidase